MGMAPDMRRIAAEHVARQGSLGVVELPARWAAALIASAIS
jgi:hypothetical protein